MGLSASTRVQKSLGAAPEFTSACAAVYADCLSLSQHAFPGVKPYQLFSATARLHSRLSQSLRLISNWLPHPPDRVHVDRALKAAVLSRRPPRTDEDEDGIVLDQTEFQEFALEVFSDAVVSAARLALLKRLPLGAAGIAGAAAVVKPGKDVVVVAIGAYALGVATSIYLSLDA
ncbi:uncharacterized protein LOC127248310 [Andrographis paniculata]|uniref:uncharacterized protein LOC127248310 n=1 Tax=Andrographis paniculata TaxID=175694 RepID=UPI0021E8350C|nr:uncharacterized protein LOC127248310 [Andrographis paniculata]